MKAFWLIIAAVMLGGCASSTTISEWSCPTNQPGGCFDVETGDQIALDALRAEKAASAVTVSSATLPRDNGTSGNTGTSGANQAVTVVQQMLFEASKIKQTHINHARIPEELAEIWIGPFEDEAGNYHPASKLFIVVHPGRWKRVNASTGSQVY